MASPSQHLLQEAGPGNLGVYKLVPDGVEISCQSGTEAFQATKSRRQIAVNKKEDAMSPWQEYGREVLEGNLVQSLTVILIITNAVVVGLETDMPGFIGWDIMETVFLIFFSCELVLRIFTFRWYFFNCMENQDIVWNMIDFVIVSAGFFTSCIVVFPPQSAGFSENATLFRTVRLLRILRILRVVRVFRFLKQLYLLAYGFVEGANAVFWVATLATACIYVCAVVLVRVYRHEDNEFIHTRFSTIPSTMFTLFEIMSDPSLGKYREQIFEYPFLTGFLVIFIIFGSFGINGLLTGVISESILEKNQARQESQRMDREKQRRDLMKECSDLFDKMDMDEVGSLTAEDILEFDDEIRLLFQNAGTSIPDYDIYHMLEVMDYDGNGYVEKSEFINGILELCEDIRPMSIMELHSAVARCNGKITYCNSNVELVMQSFEDLARDLQTRHSEVIRVSGLMTKLCQVLLTKGDQEPGDTHEPVQERLKSVILDFGQNKKDEVKDDAAVEAKRTSHVEQRIQRRRSLRGSRKSLDVKKIASNDSFTLTVQNDIDDEELQSSSKARADELLRKVSEMQVPTASQASAHQMPSDCRAPSERQRSARSEVRSARSELGLSVSFIDDDGGETWIGTPAWGDQVGKTVAAGSNSKDIFQVYEGEQDERQSMVLHSQPESETSGIGSFVFGEPTQSATNAMSIPRAERAETQSPAAHDAPQSEADLDVHIIESDAVHGTSGMATQQDSWRSPQSGLSQTSALSTRTES